MSKLSPSTTRCVAPRNVLAAGKTAKGIEMADEMKVAPITVKLDASEVMNQIEELVELFKFKTSSLESVPEHVVDLFLGGISSLIDSLVLSDTATTISAAHINEVVVEVKVIGAPHLFTAAIRAMDF